jgi:hypothetical protein
MIEPEDDQPAEKKPAEAMTEMQKYRAGEPFDSAKLYAEMDDSMMDSLIEGVSERKDEAAKPEDGPAE